MDKENVLRMQYSMKKGKGGKTPAGLSPRNRKACHSISTMQSVEKDRKPKDHEEQ
jgi:hypothetical protein